MIAHELVIEWARGGLDAKIQCNEPAGANCRLACTSGDCEEWYGPLIGHDGSLWHPIHENANTAFVGGDSWHRMNDQGECNVELFINESGMVAEMATDGHPSFIAARVPITEEWDGDGYLWRVKQ